ncbi:RRM protein [Tulasnella sp. 403]|nr:RRM protein [Tulasnella sp. 403]
MSSAPTTPPFPPGLPPGPHNHLDSAIGPSSHDYVPRTVPWPATDSAQQISYAAAMLPPQFNGYGNGHSYDMNNLVQPPPPQTHQRGQSNGYGIHPPLPPGDYHTNYFLPQLPLSSPGPGAPALNGYADPNAYQPYHQNTHPTPSITDHILAPHLAVSISTQAQPTRSTLYLSDLEPWMDVEYFNQRPFSVTWATVPASSARSMGHRGDAMSDDHTNASALFAPGGLSLLNPFIPPVADDTLAGTPQASGRQQEFSIFVGDLAPETTNSDLIAVFRDPILGLRHDREPKFVAPFTSCRSAKIMVDPVMGVSKGYGFVRFGSASDASRALIEMQGLYCLSRPMRISQATAKSRPQQGFSPGMVIPQHQVQPLGQPFLPAIDQDYQPNGSDYPEGVITPVAGARPSNSNLALTTRNPGLGARTSVSPTGSTSSSNSTRERDRPSSTTTPQQRSSNDPLEVLPSETLTALSALNIDRDTLSQLLKLAMAKSTPSSEQQDERRPPSSSSSKAGTVRFVNDMKGARDVTVPQSAPATNIQFGNIENIQHRASISSPPGQVHAASRSYSQSASGTSATTPAPARTFPNGSNSQQRAQARALLANMIGPNTGVLNSSDPYNTTVFVGGLSGLISEDTLRTFFGPFGDIHYVKIPPGKGCGFVQFVRKADAEMAIEKMQGFPIGGGRVRLSWGRSQWIAADKAAQAAAQAAQLGLNIGQLGSLQGLSETHTTQLLQSLGLSGAESMGASTPLTQDGSGSNPQVYPPVSTLSPYGAEPLATPNDYGSRGISTSASTTPGQNDVIGRNGPLSRSQTFPTFAPFGNDSSVYPPSTLTPSRTTSGVDGLSQSGSFTQGPSTEGPNSYNTIPPDARTNTNQRGLEGIPPAFGGFSYVDGPQGGYARGPNGFQANDILRQERSGSGSTVGTGTSDTNSPPRHPGVDVYDLGNSLAALNFGQNMTYEPASVQYRHGIQQPDSKVPVGYGVFPSSKSPNAPKA